MITMQLEFDPAVSEDPLIAGVFQNDVACTLYLLWRRTHIVGTEFADDVLQIAERVGALPKRPTEVAVIQCFDPVIGVHPGLSRNFLKRDVVEFAATYLPYIRGDKQIRYEVNV